MIHARRLGLTLLLLPALAAWAGGPAAGAVQQSPFGDVTLTASPSRYEGTCPARIRFEGRVGIAAHPMVFNYVFERSDGAKSQLKVARAPNANTKTVTVVEVWQVGAAGQRLHVWEKLRVASGNTRIESNQVDAEIICR